MLTVRDDDLGQLAAGENLRQSLRNVTVLNRLKAEDLREILFVPSSRRVIGLMMIP